MGCGSSSLKGDQPASVGGETAAPNIKKVATNFSDVNYSGEGKGRKDTEFAPHEAHPTTITEERGRPSADSHGAHKTEAAELRAAMVGDNAAPAGDKLAPYKSIEGDHGMISPGTENPVSNAAMENFAKENQPVNHQVSSNHKSSKDLSSSNQKRNSSNVSEKKKGWYQRYSDHKMGRDNVISDEDLEKYTGMTRVEHEKFAADPKNQLAGNQNPLRVTGSAASGFGAVSAGDGTMGWGYGDAKQTSFPPEITGQTF